MNATATADTLVLDQPLIVVPDDCGSVETVEQLKAEVMGFGVQASPLVDRATSIVVTSAGDTAGMAAAREVRLALRSIRTAAEDRRRVIKDESLRKSKAIDLVFNGFWDRVSMVEKYLERQEKFAERQEAERIAKLREARNAQIIELGDDPNMYLTGSMTDAQFAAVIEGIKARIERDKRDAAAAEAYRLAKEREQAELRKKNQELEAQAAAERKAREAADAKAADERRKRLDAEREQRELEREQREREDRERQEVERARRKAARAPDAEKVRAYAIAVASIAVPNCKTEDGILIASQIAKRASAFVAWIETTAKELS